MHVRTIINPAAGQDAPVLAILNRALRRPGVRWDVAVTHDDGDPTRLTRQAIEDGVDVVAAYGGDGTISEVASALRGTDVPLAVLPGGTGNVVAQQLGVPLELEQAARLACSGDAVSRAVDMMRMGDRAYLLRIGVGADAQVMREANRERKDSLGWLAYLVAALGQLKSPEAGDYTLRLDGTAVRLSALTCIVANIGRIGRGGVSLAEDVDPSDGELDVFVVRHAHAAALAAVGASVLGLSAPGHDDPEAPFQRYRAREVELAAAPHAAVHGDGDPVGHTPISIAVEPSAVRILLPKEEEA